MSEPCVINGKQCTQCCRVIVLGKNLTRSLKNNCSSDAAFVRANWKPMSKRRAKKANPYIFSGSRFNKDALRANVHYFRCARVTDKGCSVYERRPRVCSGYPRYDMSDEDLFKTYAGKTPEYRADCTEVTPWAVIKIVVDSVVSSG